MNNIFPQSNNPYNMSSQNSSPTIFAHWDETSSYGGGGGQALTEAQQPGH